MILDKSGSMFEDRRKNTRRKENLEVKTEKRKSQRRKEGTNKK